VDLSELHIDTQRAEEGVWQKYGDGELHVARIDSPAWRKRRAELLVERRDELRKATDAGDDARHQEIIAEIHTKLLAEICLKGWKNIRYKDRQLEFAPALAERLMTEIPLFRDEVWDRAVRLAPYKLELDEGALGNLLGSSNGKSVGGSTKRGSKSSTSDHTANVHDSTPS
jgi:hypothetical protein